MYVLSVVRGLQTKLTCSHMSCYTLVKIESLSVKNPKEMSVSELKTELKKRNLSTGGRKDILVKRLESSLWVEIP